MVQINDTEGRVTSVLCFLLLLSYHASRDVLITVLPTITNCTNATDDTDVLNSTMRLAVDDEDAWHSSPLSSAIRAAGGGVLLERTKGGGNTALRHHTVPQSKPDEDFDDSDIFPIPSPSTLSLNDTDRRKNNTHVENSAVLDYDKIVNDILADQKQLHATKREARSANDFYLPIISDKLRSSVRKTDVIDFLPTSDHSMLFVYRDSSQNRNNDWDREIASNIDSMKLGYEGPENVELCVIKSEFGEWYYQSSWSLAVQGTVLGALHWMTLPGLVLGHYCTEFSKVGEGMVGAVFTVQWAVLVLLTQLVTGWGPAALAALRAWQGLAQGASYPCVYRLLEARGLHNRMLLALLFSGPWWGSAFGMTLGSLAYQGLYWALPFYIAGGIALLVGLMLPFISPGTKKDKPLMSCSWRLVLQRDVVVTGMLHCGTVWVLHTLLIAPTLVLDPSERWWIVLVILVAGGLTAQVLEAVVDTIVPSKMQPARQHLLITTVIGLAMSIASLITIAVMAKNAEAEDLVLPVLMGCVTGAIFGIGVTSVGYRQVLEAASSPRRSRSLVFVNCAGALGAGLASVLLPSMVQFGQSMGFVSGCLFPLSLVILGTVCVFMFLIFPTTRTLDVQLDKPQENGVYVIPMEDTGVAPAASADGQSMRSTDNKSFKSIVTNTSFKSAVSRHRSRTTSYNTVMEELEGDVYSIEDDGSLEWRSVVPEGDEDMHSVRSVATSYRSTGGPNAGPGELGSQPSFSELLENGDRTSAWLHLHHHVDMTRTGPAGARPVSPPLPLPGLLW